MENFNIYTEERQEQWVSEGLEDDFREWNHHRAVLISAQTGRGKNHFIMEKVIPHAMETGQQVFIFSNRVALSTQQKKILLHKLALPSILSNEELRNAKEFGPVTVLNYQSTLEYLSKQLSWTYGNSPLGGSLKDPRRGYVIFDETHFFLSDATFNADTQRIFISLMYAFSYYTRIYLTATPENIAPIIASYEYINEERKRLTWYELSAMRRGTSLPKNSQYSNLPSEKSLAVYKFPQDYSDYNIKFFTDTNIKYLYDEMGRATKDNKWLLFINSRARQKEISTKLRDIVKAPDEIYRFDAAKKEDSEVWNSIMEGKLPKNIFLTTSVIDNGVSISDPGLKNIVIEFEDKISLLQMIGRKRRKDGEKVNIFVLSPSIQSVKDRLMAKEDLLSVIQDYRLFSFNFLQRRWKGFHQKYRDLFWINDMQQLVCNGFAEQELINLIEFYRNLLFQMQDDANTDGVCDMYPKLVLGWLGLSNNIRWVGETAIKKAEEKLRGLLEQNLNVLIPGDKTENFYYEFRELGNIIYSGKKKMSKDSRSGKKYINEALNDLKEQLKAHYVMTGDKSRGWIISKK